MISEIRCECAYHELQCISVSTLLVYMFLSGEEFVFVGINLVCHYAINQLSVYKLLGDVF